MPTRVKIAAGFLGIYLIWGSTYLAVRLAVETVPPFLMMGVRCVVAGALLCVLARAGGARRPSLAAQVDVGNGVDAHNFSSSR